jgi:hypothetical protein
MTSEAPVTQHRFGGWARAWVRFWFEPTDPIGLHLIRVAAGLLFIVWLLPQAGHRDEFFGLNGWFDQRAYAEAANLPDGSPAPLGWSVALLFGSAPGYLTAVYFGSLIVFGLFTIGIFPRLTGILSWVAVASMTSSPAILDDVEPWLNMLSFYLMIGYVLWGQDQRGRPVTWHIFGPALTGLGTKSMLTANRSSSGATVAIRLLQIHVAIAIVTSGLHKLQFGEWWSGVAYWYLLYSPINSTIEQARNAHGADAQNYLMRLSLGAYAALAWQIGFPLFAWRRGFRSVLLLGAAIGWIATASWYRQLLTGPATFVGCLAFISALEWRALFGRLQRVSGSAWLGNLATVAEQPVEAAITSPSRRVPR